MSFVYCKSIFKKQFFQQALGSLIPRKCYETDSFAKGFHWHHIKELIKSIVWTNMTSANIVETNSSEKCFQGRYFRKLTKSLVWSNLNFENRLETNSFEKCFHRCGFKKSYKNDGLEKSQFRKMF